MSLRNEGRFIGTIVKDPELRTVSAGSVTTLRLAVDNLGDSTLFVDVTFWDRNAELIAQYLKKGREVTVSYFLRSRLFEKNGVKFDSYEFVGKEIIFGKKNDDEKSK